MDGERKFKDLPLVTRLLCIFVLSLGLAMVVVQGIAKVIASCDPRPIYVRGSAFNDQPPWER
jgi:hypothetical protein